MRLGDRMYHGIALYLLNVMRVCVSIRSLTNRVNQVVYIYFIKNTKRFHLFPTFQLPFIKQENQHSLL